MNIVIIEDEPAIADNLEFLLKDIEPTLKVVKKIPSVKDAILWFHKPSEEFDLVFTDIRLSDGLSFEIFEVIKPTKPVVFVTAYDDFALKAFGANAIDYILKPFDKEDLRKALEKFKSFSTPEPVSDNFDKLLEYFKKEQPISYKQSYLVHHRTQLVPLKVADVHWFYTEDEIVYAKTGIGKTYTIDSTLEKIYTELDPNLFYRANRKFIVQRKAIENIDFYFNRRLVVNVVPKSEEKIIVSKAKAQEFKKWMDL